MTAFPKYPKYKDSGLEWLGEVPDHWEVSRSRRVFTQRKELARKDDQQLSATQAYGVIPQADYEERIGRSVVKISMHLEKRKHVEPDDFVISMRSFQGGLERAWARGAIRSSYTILEPAIKVAPSYFAYLFKCPQYIGALQSTGNFIRDGQDLTYQNYILVDLPLPPFAEQERIGAFLDEKTAEIDCLIAKKQRQIELLDEQKAILINRAVTCGVPSEASAKEAELQDSGIPWIGPIPKHWNTKRVKHVCRNIATGGTPRDVRHRNDCSDGLTWYTPGDFKVDGVLQSSERVALPKRGENVEVYPPHSIYFIGIGGTIGTINRSHVAGSCNQQINVLAIDDSANSAAYFAFLLQSAKMFVVNTSNYTTLPIINRSKTASIAVVQPPRQEQVEIAANCERLSVQTSKAKSLIESQIQTLQTLRSTLIAHAVTGKIKV